MNRDGIETGQHEPARSAVLRLLRSDVIPIGQKCSTGIIRDGCESISRVLSKELDVDGVGSNGSSVAYRQGSSFRVVLDIARCCAGPTREFKKIQVIIPLNPDTTPPISTVPTTLKSKES
jgi:hypothetical protein